MVFFSPVYRLIGVVKLVTGLISATTALALIRVIPRALALRGLAKLEQELEMRRRAEEVAAVRTRQLETLVELSRRSLATSNPNALVGEVAALAAQGLGVELCGVFRDLPGRSELQLLGGRGMARRSSWYRDSPSGDRVFGWVRRPGNRLGLSVRISWAMTGSRSLYSSNSTIRSVVWGVQILGSDGTHGVLVAYTTQPHPLVLVAHAPLRAFGDDEVWFLRSVAALLGSNLSRIEAERALTIQGEHRWPDRLTQCPPP